MSVQLNFTLRTSANCKTVHLLGSWDNYSGQLPLSKDPSKAGGWKGSFRFQGKTLKPGQRYWYYYIIDGYHVSHDPARESVVEPTTKRRLNILDIPASKSYSSPAAPSAPAKPSTSTSTRQSRSQHTRRPSSAYIAKGRSLSPSKIESPRPTKPHATRQITTESFSRVTVDELTRRFASVPINDRYASDNDDEEDGSDFSDNDSDVPSLNSSRSSNSSTPSSVSSTSSSCSCERYGITRAGGRVKLDCGGSRCGYSEGSDCESEREHELTSFARRRHGVVVH